MREADVEGYKNTVRLEAWYTAGVQEYVYQEALRIVGIDNSTFEASLREHTKDANFLAQ